jgi:hypothetical protein
VTTPRDVIIMALVDHEVPCATYVADIIIDRIEDAGFIVERSHSTNSRKSGLVKDMELAVAADTREQVKALGHRAKK